MAGDISAGSAAVDAAVIRWRLGNVTYTVEFSFFAAAALTALWGGSRYFFLVLSACLLHELGHLALLLLLRRRVHSFSLCGAGALIVPEAACCAYWQDILISLAGPCVNVLIGSVLLRCNADISAGMLHLGMGLFNLLPFPNLDGGAVCRSIFSACGILPDRTAVLLQWLGLLTAALLLALCLLSGAWSRSLWVMLCCLVLQLWDRAS